MNVKFLKTYPTARGYDVAFHRLYSRNSNTINFIIIPSYDVNRKHRCHVIAHDLCHIRDMMLGDLSFNINDKTYIYKGKLYSKVYSYTKFDKFTSRSKQVEYISPICPWEKEPCNVADKLAGL